MLGRRCVGAGFYPARGVVQNRREGQSPSPANGFTKVQTKFVSPSVMAKGHDTSLAEGGKDEGYDNPSVNASRCHLSYASPHNPV